MKAFNFEVLWLSFKQSLLNNVLKKKLINVITLFYKNYHNDDELDIFAPDE